MRKIQIYSAPSKICLPKVNVKRVSTKFLIKKFIVLAFALFCAEVLAQQLPRITQLQEDEVDISLDGFVDEPVWQSIPPIDGMKSTDPDTLEDAKYKTDIRFFYTQRGIYFGIVNHQPSESIISRLTARDTSPFDMVVDAIGVLIGK